MSNHHNSPVRHRRVFYIPGYDPFPPRRYRELYRKEAAEQSAISGYDIAIKAGLSEAGFGWQVASKIDGQPVKSEIEVLVWSDLVQKSRPTSIFETYKGLILTAWVYLSTGALFRLMRLRKGPTIAALYPVLALLVQAAFSVFLGWAMYRIAHRMGQEIAGDSLILFGIFVASCLGVGVAGLTLKWFRDNDGKFYAYYLMHDFAYSASARGAYPADLETRLTQFRCKVEAALRSDVDEVLVVGHSSGAHLSISLLSDLLKDAPIAATGPSLGFLSLGHVVPMISFLPKADRLRRDLKFLSQCHDVTWVDVTAPGDGCCFALCDPVAVSGQSTPAKTGPLVFSAAFTQSLSPELWRSLRWRFFRLHFQYLCAFDQPKDYDYFQITAGPMRLKERYATRVPSKSRVEKTVSAYTSAAL